jgi:signal transduction histidine kinase
MSDNRRLHGRLRGLELRRAVFWVFFVPYVGGVAVWLIVGLVPAVVHESATWHRALHERAGDSLRAGREVTIHFENRANGSYNIRLIGHDRRAIFSGRVVVGPGRADYRFEAPAPGSYRIESALHREMIGELRFTANGADSLGIRVNQYEERFAKVGAHGWNGLAQRIADASHRTDHAGRVILETLFSVLNLGLGLLLILRRPRDHTVRLLAVGMIGTAATFNHQSHVMLRDFLLGNSETQHLFFHLASGMAYMFAVVVFPDGRLVPRVATRTARLLLRVTYGFAAFVIALFVLGGSDVSHPGQVFFTVLFGLAIPVVGVVAQTYRLRREVDLERRQQSRLLRWALMPMLVAGIAYFVVSGATNATAGSATYGVAGNSSRVEELGLAVFPALFALVPVALVMGVLRYRLLDIDVLISKTLLSVGLAVFIGAVYVVVVVVLGHAAGPGDSAAFKIAATAIAAVAFEPVRERLQRLAHRLVYGERATPYEVMTDFGDRLANVISVDEVLQRMAEAVALGIGAVASRVTAFLPGGGERSLHWPTGDATATFTRVVTVLYLGEPVGEIAVAKASSERLTPVDDELLRSLAAQAGLAFNNARLTMELQTRLQEISAQAEDLRSSRQRIVAAREAQRQRVVQLIHERVESRLEAADAQLVEVERLLPAAGDRAIECFDELLAACGESLDALRALARGIFPAVLADQGVVPALQAHVLQAGLPVEIVIEGHPGRFDPNAEASVYFCVAQALTNAGTYASGSHVTVRLTSGVDQLAFSVVDDGPGVDPRRLAQGADIQDMRDRVEAVGGGFEASSALGQGTVVSGWVPARSLEAV